MKYLSWTLFFGLILSLSSCNGKLDAKRSGLSIQIADEKPIFPLNETIQFSLENPKGLVLKDVQFSFDGNNLTTSNNQGEISLVDQKVGVQHLQAMVVVDEDTLTIQKKLTVVSDQKPKLYGYEVINEFPHDINAYTQGLEFHDGVLYEGTGQYEKSSLRKVDYATGEVLKNLPLSKNLFGEGISILDGNIYQLTWKARTGYVYDLETFERKSSFAYGKSKEGWGLCNDGQKLYKSDGTEKIWTLNPETLVEEGFIQCYTNKKKIPRINELEWVKGKIYANQYQQNGVAIINPVNGVVEGVVDFSPLKKQVQQHDQLDVLNGIAYNPATETIFVTGKNWNKLFEVRIIEK